MGNIISRNKPVKERLFDLEKRISSLEYKLASLKLNNFLTNLLKVSLFVLPIFAVSLWHLDSISDDFLLIVLALLLLFLFILFYYLLHLWNSRKIRNIEEKLKQLKNERKDLIEICKNDIEFATTKSLIDKYQELENKDSFFSQVIPRKKSGMDSVTDLIMGNDPEKMSALICIHCGMHNGLIDPMNNQVEHFFCYSCKHKNTRKIEQVTSR